MRIRHFFSIVLCLFAGLTSASGQSKLVTVEDHDSLTVYYPHFKRIDFVTERMPGKSEKPAPPLLFEKNVPDDCIKNALVTW